MLAPENWAYNGDVPRYPYDPFKASRLLDEAGYPIGPTGMRDLKFVYKTTPEGRRLGEAIQAMLRRSMRDQLKVDISIMAKPMFHELATGEESEST